MPKAMKRLLEEAVIPMTQTVRRARARGLSKQDDGLPFANANLHDVTGEVR